MRILLTRPQADNKRTAAALAQRGHSAIQSPLIDIRPLAGEVDLTGMGAIAFTSANAVKVVAGMEALHGLPAFAVGGRTADAARRAGFDIAGVAQGSAQSLADEIASNWRPDAGGILHLSGSHVRGDLVGTLRDRGFEAKRQTVYESHVNDELTSEARVAIQENAVDAAFFFSPRSARHFQSLAAKHELVPQLSHMDAICLSAAIAEALDQHSWNRIVVAPRAELSAMIDLLVDQTGEPRTEHE